jgi:hypothetical protein
MVGRGGRAGEVEETGEGLIDGEGGSEATAADAEGGGEHAVDSEKEAAEFVVEGVSGGARVAGKIDGVAAGDGPVVGVEAPMEETEVEVEAVEVVADRRTEATRRANGEVRFEVETAIGEEREGNRKAGVLERGFDAETRRVFDEVDVGSVFGEPLGDLFEEVLMMGHGVGGGQVSEWSGQTVWEAPLARLQAGQRA